MVSTSEHKFGIGNESNRSTVSSDGSYTTPKSSEDVFKGFDYVSPEYSSVLSEEPSINNSSFRGSRNLTNEERVAARKAELEASQQKQQEQQELAQQSDRLERENATSLSTYDKVDRILRFFSPTFTLLSAIPIVGEILDTVGEFVVKFKEDRRLIAAGDLLFKNTDQMFEKIAVMEKIYETSTPVTISTKQVGGANPLPHEFIKLIELLEELYITLLDMVLTEQRINLIAKQLQTSGKYQYKNADCGNALLNFSGLNCDFNDKLLAYIDSRQTIQPKIGAENANKTATNWVFSKLKKVGKSIYRYGVASEVILQLHQMNTLINTAFNIALSQYVLDVKDQLEEKIREIQSAAAAEVKQVETSIGINAIRESINSIQTSNLEQDLRKSAAAAGGKITKKMRSKKTMKQQQKRNGKTHKQNKQQ